MTKFSDWIVEHAHGELDDLIGAAIDEVADGVLLVDKKPGTVTVTISMTKSGRMIAVSGDVKTKIPRPEPESTLYYLSKDGLSKDDPMQLALVDRENQPTFAVDADGVAIDPADPDTQE